MPVVWAKPTMISFECKTESSTLVDSALVKLNKENSLPLRELVLIVSQANQTKDEVALASILGALTNKVARLDSKDASTLITTLLASNWMLYESTTVDLFVRFFAQLATGLPKWWQEVATKAVEGFVLSASRTSYNHTLLKHIFRTVPTSLTRIMGIFARLYPHKMEQSQESTNYVDNLLMVLEYAPELDAGIWGLLLERTLQLDVECELMFQSLKDDEDDDDEEEEDEDDDDENDRDEQESEDEAPPLKKRRIVEGEEITEAELTMQQDEAVQLHSKLDDLICNLLDYLSTKLSASALEPSASAARLFIVLMDKFRELVLPCHKTRSVQFLMFQVVHCHSAFSDAFLTSLLDVAFSPSMKMDTKQKAMQYVASFVARARGISRTQVVGLVTFLASWVNRYIDEREREVDTTTNMAKFRMFYVATQTLFYIFCFRHALLRKENSSTAWEADLGKLFQRLIVTKFNPLRFCKSTVVAMFARIAQRENVVFCFSVIEQNRLGRSQNENTASSNRSQFDQFASVLWPNHREFEILENYFPFDPIPLRRAKPNVAPNYIEWNEVNEDSDSESSEEDEIE